MSLNSDSEKEPKSPILRSEPREITNPMLKKGSCDICKIQAEVKSLRQIDETIKVCGKHFSRREILEQILIATKIIKENKSRYFKMETNFAKKFCYPCLEKYSSPMLFKECQNKSCKNPQISKTSMKPDLELYEKLAPKKFKLCKVPTAVFCQYCRNAKLNELEKRVLNLLLDRQL